MKPWATLQNEKGIADIDMSYTKHYSNDWVRTVAIIAHVNSHAPSLKIFHRNYMASHLESRRTATLETNCTTQNRTKSYNGHPQLPPTTNFLSMSACIKTDGTSHKYHIHARTSSSHNQQWNCSTQHTGMVRQAKIHCDISIFTVQISQFQSNCRTLVVDYSHSTNTPIHFRTP